MTPEVERQSEEETGRVAIGTGRAPGWLLPSLVVLAALLIFWAFFQPVPGWAGWIVFGGIVVVVIGLIIAVNPNRRSPVGGTRRR